MKSFYQVWAGVLLFSVGSVANGIAQPSAHLTPSQRQVCAGQSSALNFHLGNLARASWPSFSFWRTHDREFLRGISDGLSSDQKSTLTRSAIRFGTLREYRLRLLAQRARLSGLMSELEQLTAESTRLQAIGREPVAGAQEANDAVRRLDQRTDAVREDITRTVSLALSTTESRIRPASELEQPIFQEDLDRVQREVNHQMEIDVLPILNEFDHLAEFVQSADGLLIAKAIYPRMGTPVAFNRLVYEPHSGFMELCSAHVPDQSPEVARTLQVLEVIAPFACQRLDLRGSGENPVSSEGWLRGEIDWANPWESRDLGILEIREPSTESVIARDYFERNFQDLTCYREWERSNRNF